MNHNEIAALFRHELCAGWDNVIYGLASQWAGNHDAEAIKAAIREAIATHKGDAMKAEALTDSTIELPNAQIAVELLNSETVAATGFIVRSNERGERIIILKAGKKPMTVLNG